MLKVAEICNRHGRKDPITGISEDVVVTPYFRNTHCIMGFVTMNRSKHPPCLYSIGEENHKSAAYMAFIISAVASGWVVRGDFVVVDNAIVHSGGLADILSDFLWSAPSLDGEALIIVVVPFPTRVPEINPIELNWHTFVLRLKRVRLEVLNYGGGG